MKRAIHKRIVHAVVAMAVIVFASVAMHAGYYAPELEVAPSPALANIAETNAKATGQSARLSIPKLSINAHVQSVGITTKGNVGTPNNFTDVGWYKYGSLPGKPGTAIIDGHVDNGLSLPGVFKDLNKLEVGDDVYIVTKEGTTLHFVVTGMKTYAYNASTDDIFTNHDDGASRLLLITCAGTWVQANHTHDQRLVVTTELV